MIKFIASDLDGTLLPPSKGVSAETFEIICDLYKKGMIFCAASGRQLPNVKKLFAPVLDKIAIIAENGGIGWFDGKIIYSNPTPCEQIDYALSIIEKENDLYPLLSCADCAYYQSPFAPFIETVNKSYSSVKKADLHGVCQRETVYKISVWDGIPPSATHGIKLADKIQGLRVMISGFDWLDVSALNANKGLALKRVLQYFNVDSRDCMAFGDHMNDLEMLQLCGRAYVTANAFGGLKEKIPNTVLSNAENGVVLKLKELLAELK